MLVQVRVQIATRIVLLLLFPTVSYSWGTTGHEIVANVAWNFLSNETKAWARTILNTTDDEEDQSPLGVVADWADRVRHFLPWSAPLHYIDVRDDLLSHGCHVSPHLNPTCRFEYSRDCPDNTCVAGAIVNYTHQLRQTKPLLRGSILNHLEEIPDTKEALMFLIHFIGDIHQPLHCSRVTDKGGNDIHVHFNLLTHHQPTSHHHTAWNLHSVWDTGLINVALTRNYNQSRELLEQDLLAQLEANRHNYLDCDDALGANLTCTIQWGQESWDAAIRYAYTLQDNQTDIINGATLDEEYYNTRWPLAKERLLAGAARLAGTLEWLVQKNQQTYHPPTQSSMFLLPQGQSPDASFLTSRFLSWLAWNERILLLVRKFY